MNQEVDSLTIRVAGKGDDYITADSFLEVVREAIGILHGLDERGTLVWKLKSASINSPLSMTFVAEPRADAEDWKAGVSRDYLSLFRRLDRGEPIGPGVPEKVALRAKHLVDVLNDGVAKITFSAPGEPPVSPTQRVQATVAEMVETRRDQYTDHAAIEGDLRTVTVQGGSRFHIYDRVTGHRITCEIPHDRLPDAKEALERRVSVSGRTRYKAGKPVHIDVETLEVLPGREGLPQFEDIKGIDPTDGVESVAYVRRQRDAW